MFQKLKGNYKNLKQSILSINWNRNWEEEEVYLKMLILKRLEYPRSFVYDSLFQYRAQIYQVAKTRIFLLNFISFFGFFLLVIKFFFAKKNKSSTKYDVAYFYDLNIFDDQILMGKNLVFISSSEGLLMSRDILYLIRLMFILRFNFIMLSTIAFRLSQVVYAKENYDVSEVWTNMEYSCASGAIKVYCNENEICFNNFMHGEKVLTLRDCFSSFDKFYVWSLDYLNLMKTMKTNSEIIISNPWNTVDVIKEGVEKNSICYLLKGIETKEEIIQLNGIFKKLQDNGYVVYIKDHPRQYTVSSEIEGVTIIDKKINFLNITSKIECFMAQYSTILTQCKFMDIDFIIDDVSNIDIFQKLKNRKYVNAVGNTNLLSTILK